jgi:hypothetical protein
MSRSFRSIFTVLGLASILVAGASPAIAQSGSRTPPPRAVQPQGSGSATRAPAQATLALEGYCPVSVVEMRKWVKGDPAYQSVFDGHLYRFANADGKACSTGTRLSMFPRWAATARSLWSRWANGFRAAFNTPRFGRSAVPVLQCGRPEDVPGEPVGVCQCRPGGGRELRCLLREHAAIRPGESGLRCDSQRVALPVPFGRSAPPVSGCSRAIRVDHRSGFFHDGRLRQQALRRFRQPLAPFFVVTERL